MTEAVTTQERYARAVQSSSLRIEVGERGDADILIAAGWCKSRFGGGLMRLRAEWDGAERWGIRIPLKPTKRAIMVEAQVRHERKTVQHKGGGREVLVRKITKDSMQSARVKLESRYESELKRVFSALKTLPAVTTDLQIKLALDGVSSDLAAPLLLYWLDPVCKVCGGTGFQAKAEKGCGKCREHPGLAAVPGGEEGRRVLAFLNGCAGHAANEVRDYCRP